jgi:hypothetical protein
MMSDLTVIIEPIYFSEDVQVIGNLTVHEPDGDIIFDCNTLMLGWHNNQRRISHIPEGVYEVVRHQSPRFGDCFLVKDVPGRDHILFHKGNYHRDTLGCILVGEYRGTDIDGDGFNDLVNSSKTFNKFKEICGDGFTLQVL